MPVTHLASAAVARALTARHREAAIAHTPGMDNTRLFMSLTAGAGTRSKVITRAQIHERFLPDKSSINSNSLTVLHL